MENNHIFGVVMQNVIYMCCCR